MEAISDPIATEHLPIARLHPHPENYLSHPEREIDDLRASLRQFGHVRSIVVQIRPDGDYTVLAGNGILTAAQAEGLPWLLARIVPATWTDAMVKAYLIADNEPARKAERDDVQLLSLLQEVQAQESALVEAAGFSQTELEQLLHTVKHQGPAGDDPGAQTDRAEELRQQWQVETGQLWQLGEHRLICGDCADPVVVEQLMRGEKAQLIFTDPPYGVAIGAKNRLLNSVLPSGRNSTDIEDDSLSPQELKANLLPAFANMRRLVMADDCTIFVTAPQGGELGMMMMMIEAGLPVRHVLIWKKNQPTFSLGRLDYDYQHEPILLTWGKRHKRPMAGPQRTSVWEIDKPRASADHPTMKPVELVENALLNNSEYGDTVYDGYLGSGTTLIACEHLGRRCRAVEISAAYVAVALQRWSDMIGRQPKLMEGG